MEDSEFLDFSVERRARFTEFHFSRDSQIQNENIKINLMEM